MAVFMPSQAAISSEMTLGRTWGWEWQPQIFEHIPTYEDELCDAPPSSRMLLRSTTLGFIFFRFHDARLNDSCKSLHLVSDC